MNIKKSILFFILCAQSLLIHGQDKTSVLFLVSYDSSFPTFSLQYRGLIEGFEERNKEIDLHIEFLDSKRFPFDQVKTGLYDSLRNKNASGNSYEYVITADDNALKFVDEYYEELFQESPVVFFGVNDLDLAYSHDRSPGITGFVEEISYKETLQTIIDIMPDIEELYILHDATSSGSGDYKRVLEINKSIDFIDIQYLSLAEMSFEELYQKVSALDVNQPILLLSAFVDKNEKIISFNESIDRLSLNSGAPIFHLWRHGIGDGLLGGKVVDHEFYGTLSAFLVSDLMDGKHIHEIKISTEKKNRFIFDYNVLEKYKINLKSLPSDSIIVNKPQKLSKNVVMIFISLTSIIITLFFMLFLILKMYTQKSSAEKEIRSLYRDLEKERESLSVTLQSIGDGVIATDLNCNISFINNVTASLTGWSLQDVIGKPLDDVFNIVNENSREQCDNPAKIVIETGKIIELANHTCLIAKDGTSYVIEDSAAPIKDHDGNIIGVIIVFRDTTEKKQLRDASINNQKLESLGLLAGGIAHDFNNYLAGIFGYIELVKNNLLEQGSSENVDYLSKVLDISKNAKSLTQQLLTFSKGGVPSKKNINLTHSIQSSVEFAVRGSRVVPEVKITENLWNCVCDENQIGQCLDNLIINALQAMSDDGSLKISAKNVVYEENKYVEISVTDTGSGIPSHILNKIYDPFFTTKETGRGLGLASVFSILKNHDGWIDVSSGEGQGTRFTFFLPASESPPHQDSLSENLSLKKGSGKILILDDQDYILEVLEAMLIRLGYSVVAVSEGEKAISKIREDSLDEGGIDACILDLTLPGDMSGQDVATRIREISPKTILIASSGYAESPVIAYPKKFGFNDSITKPFNLDELAVILEENLLPSD